MELHQHTQLLACLKEAYRDNTVVVTFTQWDGEEEDEQVTQFQGTLSDIVLSDNKFGTKDLQLTFAVDEEQVVEILMELPAEEEDLAFQDEKTLRVFGTEAELVITLHT
ncbi:MAG: hypothetical protein H0Z34_05960 [Brevibacillus sp.]|nr:hypothetical protein [Brevibacillus sp.]